ncbi:MAG: hypothetical protein IJU45_06170 [Clostridia bacterium]|nr:hypothetical protein [Clostridia bacterium]
MTYERLKRYRALEQRLIGIKAIINELDWLENLPGDMPLIQKAKLDLMRKRQNEQYNSTLNELAELTRFINGIRDEETKKIFILHFINGFNYGKTAEIMFYNRRTIYNRVNRYLYAQTVGKQQ